MCVLLLLRQDNHCKKIKILGSLKLIHFPTIFSFTFNSRKSFEKVGKLTRVAGNFKNSSVFRMNYNIEINLLYFFFFIKIKIRVDAANFNNLLFIISFSFFIFQFFNLFLSLYRRWRRRCWSHRRRCYYLERPSVIGMWTPKPFWVTTS